jgi:hypothetical protein
MYVWMPIAAWGVIGLIRALIDWQSRVGYERARAASVASGLQAVPAGAIVRDQHADGTMLYVMATAQNELGSAPGTHDPARGNLAEPQ